MLWKTGGQKEQPGAFVEDERRDELLRRAVDDPEQFAGVGIVARDAFASRENHLRAARDGADDRHAVAARFVWAVDAPEFAPVGARASATM